MRVEWSSARVAHGELYVMTSGVLLMPEWSADSSTILPQVKTDLLFLLWRLKCIIVPIDATAYSNARFGQGSGPIYLDNVQCAGTEAMLGDCRANAIGSHNCVHREDAGVGCQGMHDTSVTCTW